MLVSEPMYIKGMMKSGASYVLVDLRDAKAAAKGHIKGAYNMPGKLKADQFPLDKSAPIILYSAKTAGKDAYTTVKKWGYKNVTVLSGGVSKWAASDGRLVSEKMPTGKIAYVKRIARNQVSVKEFQMVLKDKPGDKVILDVRDAGTPKLPGAMQIALSDLDGQMSTLPRNKEILIHCNTGVLASMAQKKLEKAGLKSRYLDAVVQVAEDGTYEVSAK